MKENERIMDWLVEEGSNRVMFYADQVVEGLKWLGAPQRVIEEFEGIQRDVYMGIATGDLELREGEDE